MRRRYEEELGREGHWVVRLMAREAVKQGLVERGAEKPFACWQLNHGLQPWQEKCGGRRFRSGIDFPSPSIGL
jgi:hypothetical protein